MTKKYVRKSKEVCDFILDKIMEGKTPAQICRLYPEQTPDVKEFYRWQAKDVELKDKVSDAYYVYYQLLNDELMQVSSGLASELYPGADFREAEAALKRRMDALKFSLGKMSPIMTNRMIAKQKVEHSGEVEGVVVNIVDYGKDKDE